MYLKSTAVDLTDAVLGGDTLRRADVTNANFQGVELASVTMEFANFSKARNAVIPQYTKDLRQGRRAPLGQPWKKSSVCVRCWSNREADGGSAVSARPGEAERARYLGLAWTAAAAPWHRRGEASLPRKYHLVTSTTWRSPKVMQTEPKKGPTPCGAGPLSSQR